MEIMTLTLSSAMALIPPPSEVFTVTFLLVIQTAGSIPIHITHRTRSGSETLNHHTHPIMSSPNQANLAKLISPWNGIPMVKVDTIGGSTSTGTTWAI